MENNRIIRFWVSRSMRDFHVFLGVTAVASWMVGNLSQNPKMHMLADILTLFAIVHFFVHGYFYRQQKFLSDNQRVYALPKKKIARTGGIFLVAFLAFAGAGIAVVREVYKGTLMLKMKALWMYFLGMVFGAFLKTDGLGTDELTLAETEEILGGLGQVSAKEEASWEVIVNYIQTILIVVGIICLIVLCITIFVNYVRHLVNSNKESGRDRQAMDVNDREETLWGKSTKRESILDFSANAKARRIYRRCVNRLRKRGQSVPEHLTPAEIESLVSMPTEEKYVELHQIYEKARYSETGCNEEDAKRAKELKV